MTPKLIPIKVSDKDPTRTEHHTQKAPGPFGGLRAALPGVGSESAVLQVLCSLTVPCA